MFRVNLELNIFGINLDYIYVLQICKIYDYFVWIFEKVLSLKNKHFCEP